MAAIGGRMGTGCTGRMGSTGQQAHASKMAPPSVQLLSCTASGAVLPSV
jgi:hypothetical protein